MRILFEEHQYPADKNVRETLKEICDLQDVEKKFSVSYVGYYYSPTLQDCVFILPKVLLTDVKVKNSDDGKTCTVEELANVSDDEGNILHIRPEDIITAEGQCKHLPDSYRKFIYNFAVWVYRSLSVYRSQNPTSKAIFYKQLPQEGRGRKHTPNTFLDVILSLIRFNRENQDFFMFTIRNIHSGNNKINWIRTISHTTAFVNKDEVVYLNPVNKKSQINFDEELFIIFFSILQYLNDQYGFGALVNCQYELIKGKQFQTLLNGKGKTKLRSIKYKYFSDRSIQLWNLCYAFFDSAHKLVVNTSQQEYLLAKNYEHVFEAMVDELIGDKNLPSGLKEQNDGKRVDHMYTYRSLTSSNDDSDDIFYIGDSKYYKNGHELEYKSIYKQYTYARNVIQWNIDLLFDEGNVGRSEDEKRDLDDDRRQYGKIRLRDDENDPLTEGYNVIPNFFISAYVSEDRKYVEKNNIRIHTRKEDGKDVHSTYISYQYKDRLFDRDTLILSHYHVNFLYVLFLYGRNKQYEKSVWRRKVRDLFREEIRGVLENKYDFYALKSIGNPLAGEQFISEHFKELQGKLYRPYGDRNLFVLALEQRDGGTNNSNAYQLLSEYFVITPIDKLGDNPKEKLDQEAKLYQTTHPYTPASQLPDYHVEGNLDRYFVVGLYHDQEHWDWITGKNDKGSLIYNVRLTKDRAGAQKESQIRKMKPKFVILYEEGHEADNIYHVFRVHDYAVMNQARMERAEYPKNNGGPKGDYFIFRFDEEISIGRYDIAQVVSDMQKGNSGTPVYLKGEDLLKYKL